VAARDKDAPIRLEYRPLRELLMWPRNPKDHDLGLLRDSFERFGFTEPLIVDERTGRLAAGHGRLKTLQALQAAGAHPPARILVANGDWLVPVIRGIAFRNDTEHEAYLVAANRTVIAGGWDDPVLKEVLVAVGASDAGLAGVGFDVDDIEALIGQLDKQRGSLAATPVPTEVWVTPGDRFALGPHRLACGNATQRDRVAELLGDAKIDAILTDPPYCSGGFQEADRIQGSIGRQKTALGERPTIANDVLSMRGYRSLLTTVLDAWPAKIAYLFTDWRMWATLTDLLETQGYSIRAMLVWDKGQPGMGVGWRAQHELIACGSRVRAPFSQHVARGNILRYERAGHAHHPTEKPVELLREILRVTTIARTVADPFAGSGSTILACELAGRVCYAMELEPAYVQACLERWTQATGKTWQQIAGAKGRRPARRS
jgi:DNA modification methylase